MMVFFVGEKVGIAIGCILGGIIMIIGLVVIIGLINDRKHRKKVILLEVCYDMYNNNILVDIIMIID